MLTQRLGRTFDQTVALGYDDDGPAVLEFVADVVDRAIRLALKSGHGGGIDSDVVVAVAEFARLCDFRGSRVERAQRPPGPVAGCLPKRVHAEEVAGIQIDRSLSAGRRRVPGGAEKLAVRLDQADRPGCDPLGREHGNRRTLRKIVSERNEPVDERRRERLHAVDWDAFRDFREHLGEARKLVLHLLRALPHGGAEQQLPAGREFDGRDRLRKRALVGDRERADLLDLVAEELDAPRMLGNRREHVEDAAAHRKFAAPGDHVDTGICQVDQLPADVGEIVATPARREFERFDAREIVGERLQGCPHTGDDDEVAGRIPLPALQVPKGPDALADGLRARAQPFVRKCLPGRKLDHVGVGHDAAERLAQRFGIPAGRDNRKQRLWARSGIQKAGYQRRTKAIHEREIGAACSVFQGVFERVGARKRCRQALEDHSESLRSPSVTLAARHPAHAARRVGSCGDLVASQVTTTSDSMST